MRRTVVALGLLSVALGGCVTNLSSQPAPSASMGQGLAYQLPDLVYRVDVRRAVTGCVKDPDRMPAYTAGGELSEFSVKATAMAAYVAGRPVLISYAELGKPTKTTDFKVTTYPSGMIKTINVAEDDRTAQVIAQAGKTVIGVGKLALALNGGVLPTAGGPKPLVGSPVVNTYALVVCSEDGLSAVKLAAAAKATLTRKTADLAAAAAALTQAASTEPAEPAKVAVASKSPAAKSDGATPAVAADSKPAASAEDTLKKAQKAVADAQKAQDAAQEAYNAAVKAVAVTSTVRFRPERQSKPVVLDMDAPGAEVVGWAQTLLQMKVVQDITTVDAKGKAATSHAFAYFQFDPTLQPIKPAGDPGLSLYSAATAQMASARTKLTDLDAVVVHSLLASDWEAPPATPPAPGADRDQAQLGNCRTDAKAPCGVVYRTIATGRLQVCRAMNASECAGVGEAGDPKLLVRDDRNVPQAAALVSLPLRNGIFVSNALQAAFREDGTVDTFSYAKPTAEAEVGLTALNGLVGDLTTAAENKRDAPLEAVKRATALEAARTELAKAQYEREDAAKARTASELQTVQGDTTLTEAVTAKVNAQIALAEAEAKLAKLQGEAVP
jgi:hypothetical protein